MATINGLSANIIYAQLLASGLDTDALKTEINAQADLDARTDETVASLLTSTDATRIIAKICTTPGWADTVAAGIKSKILNVNSTPAQVYAWAKSGAFTFATPYTLTDVTVGGSSIGQGQSDATGYTEVAIKSVTGDRVAVIITIGQSTWGNTVWGNAFTPVNAKVHHLSIHDGKIYTAQNTLLGPNQTRGNAASRLADKWITDGRYDRVIICAIAMGGTTVAQWATGGDCNHRIGVAVSRIFGAGLYPTFILWEQGAADNTANTSQANYTTALNSVIATFRNMRVTCPFFVARESYDGTNTDSNITNGQTGAVNNPLGVYAGPDTDVACLPAATYRTTDGIHMDAVGAVAQINAWNSSVATVMGWA